MLYLHVCLTNHNDCSCYWLEYTQSMHWQCVASVFHISIDIYYYLISVVETVIHKPGDEWGLSNCTNTVTDTLVFDPDNQRSYYTMPNYINAIMQHIIEWNKCCAKCIVHCAYIAHWCNVDCWTHTLSWHYGWSHKIWKKKMVQLASICSVMRECLQY